MKIKRIIPEECVSEKRGIAMECYNLRYDSKSETLRGVREGRELCDLESDPVYADSTGYKTSLLGMRSDGCLIHEVDLFGEKVEWVKKEICRPSEYPLQVVKAGDYLVLNSPGGRHEFIYKNAEKEEYSYMGMIPGVPSHRVVRTAGPKRSVAVKRAGFARKVSDLRNPGAEVTVPVGEAVKEAFRRAVREIDGRYFTGSVLVCVGLRMHDGEFMSVGIPVAAARLKEATADTVLLQPIEESGSYVATGESTMWLNTNLLSLTFEEAIPTAWHAHIREVEVWISAPMGLDAETDASVGYNSDSGLISATVRCADSESCAARLLKGKMRLAATLKPWELPCSIELTNAPQADETPFKGVENSSELSFRHITAHGGFLHAADVERRYPEPRLPFKPDKEGPGECRVSILLSRDGELCRLEYSGPVDAPDNLMQPFFYYPAAEAVEAIISLRNNGGSLYESRLPLSGVADGREGSSWHQAGTTAFALTPVEKWTELSLPVVSSRREPGKVMTMKRGNPLVIKSVTEHCGAPTRGIEAQPVGGGAYTRQYLYIFTDTGTVCLTHDNEGKHCVCRPVSAHVPRSMRQVSPSDQGVWMVDRQGYLLLMRDSWLSVEASGLSPDCELYTDQANLELVIADRETDQSKIVRLQGGLSPLKFRTRGMNHNFRLIATSNGVYELRGSSAAGGGSLWSFESKVEEHALGIWRSGAIEVATGGETLVFFYGDGKDVEIWVRYRDSETGRQHILTNVTTDGVCHFPLLLPTLSSDYGIPCFPKITIEVNGKIERFDRIEIL